jgi:hypothetical protein
MLLTEAVPLELVKYPVLTMDPPETVATDVLKSTDVQSGCCVNVGVPDSVGFFIRNHW